jgi:hypothetical protein
MQTLICFCDNLIQHLLWRFHYLGSQVTTDVGASGAVINIFVYRLRFYGATVNYT